MALQNEVDLNQPLDASKPSTLSKSALTPELSHAAITIHGDYYRQLQMRLNKYVFWHPISVTVYTIIATSVLSYRLWDYIVISESIREFLSFFYRSRDFLYQILGVFPVGVVVVGCFGLLNWLASDDLRCIADNLIQRNYIGEIFGFEIAKFRKLNVTDKITPKEIKLLAKGDNSQLMIYRESPIAIATLNPLYDNSTESNFVVKITGLHVRKVFRKVDFESLMIDWAILRSRQIFQEYVGNTKSIAGCKITVIIDAYSFDQLTIDILKRKQFGVINEDINLNPFEKKHPNLLMTLFQKLFNVKRQTYGITIMVQNENDDTLLKIANELGFLKKRK